MWTTPLQPTSLYQLLELPTNASNNQIKKSYHNLAKKHHPDKLSQYASDKEKSLATERLKTLNQAYNTLSNEILRNKYDCELKELEKQRQKEREKQKQKEKEKEKERQRQKEKQKQKENQKQKHSENLSEEERNRRQRYHNVQNLVKDFHKKENSFKQRYKQAEDSFKLEYKRYQYAKEKFGPKSNKPNPSEFIKYQVRYDNEYRKMVKEKERYDLDMSFNRDFSNMENIAKGVYERNKRQRH